MNAILYESINTKEERLKVSLDWHDDPEIIYFKNGHYKLTLNLREYEIQDECICIVNAGVLRKLESIGAKGNAYSLRFHLEDLCFRQAEDPVNTALLEPLASGQLHFADFITVSDFGFLQILRIFNEMVRRFRDYGTKTEQEDSSVRTYALPAVADQLMITADLLRLIALFDANALIHEKEESESEKQVLAIKETIQYIRTHYQEKIYVRNLSELTGLNEQYFIRFFGSVTGESPLDYVNAYRVEQAARLLKDSDTHVYEIAEQCGFHNIGNFIKIFRSFMGQTPHKYRKQFGREDD